MAERIRFLRHVVNKHLQCCIIELGPYGSVDHLEQDEKHDERCQNQQAVADRNLILIFYRYRIDLTAGSFFHTVIRGDQGDVGDSLRLRNQSQADQNAIFHVFLHLYTIAVFYTIGIGQLIGFVGVIEHILKTHQPGLGVLMAEQRVRELFTANAGSIRRPI